MDFQKIIGTARQRAQSAREQGLKSVRLPVLAYEDWALLYNRNDLNAQQAHYAHQKRNYYFRHFLEKENIEVRMIRCIGAEVIEWAMEDGHPLNTDSERAHVLAHYTNQPNPEPTKCVHRLPLTEEMIRSGVEVFATISIFGESPEAPEILSTIIHTRDGRVVDTMEVLAVEHTTQEAFEIAQKLMESHGVENAFHDPVVRRLKFCPDCNELVGNMADEMEYNRIK